MSESFKKNGKEKLSLGKKLLIVGGIGTAGVALTAGLVTGIGSNVSAGGEKSPDPTSTSVVENNYQADIGPNDNEFAPKDLEIPAGLSSEQIAKLIVEDRLTKWANAGFNTTFLDTAFGINSPSVADASSAEAKKQAAIFEQALFVPGWESTNLADLASNSEAINADTLNLAARTSDRRLSDVAFTRGATVDSVQEISNDGTTRTISVEFTETSNADKVTFPTSQDKELASRIATSRGVYTFTLVKSADGQTEQIQASNVKPL